jgi:formylglycine-generating enzyme required for sulfatase activity
MSRWKHDVFLSHHSDDKPEIERLARILEGQGLKTWLDKSNLVAGDPWQPELEKALLESRTCAVFVGTRGLGPWQHQEMRLAIQRQVESRQADERFRVIPVLLPGATRGDRAKLPPFLTANTWVEFHQGLAIDQDRENLQRLIDGIRGLAIRPCRAAEPDLHDGPYRGLEFFDVRHAGLFFGRDDVVDWLLSSLRGTQSKDGPTRFLAILGASGSGKSSVARAGLMHALRQGALPNSAAWPQTICRPGNRPLESLVKALAEIDGFRLGEGAYGRILPETIQTMLDSPRCLYHTVLLGLPPAQRLVLLVDQFEELFTQATEQAQAFIDNLLYAAMVEDSPVIVILTMRADFYGKCGQYPSLANAVSSHQSLVGPMTEVQLREAILRPAELIGARFDPGLADLLVREVHDEPGALPLLEFALRELWKRQHVAEDDHGFTVDAYREIGGLRGALERHANGVLRNLGGDTERELCRRILLRLVQPGEGAPDTKRRVPWGEILPDAAEPAPVEKIIKRLADERLIVTDGDYVEIAHEALIRDWNVFAQWIDADRAGLRIQRRLTEAADEWARSHADASQRDEGLLYHGTPLAVAREWAEKNPRELNPLEREFLDASTRSEDDRRQRELDNARRLAESYREQTAVLVQATVMAPDEDFPTAVGRLRVYRDDALEPLRRVLKDPKTTARQLGNAALALAAFGEDLRTLRPALALAPDPAARTRFLHHYGEFRSDLRDASRVLEAAKLDPDSQAADFRSGLCAALGQIPWNDMTSEEQEELRTTMVALYRESPDGGTHSAASYALNRWGQQAALPRLAENPMPWLDRDWAVNNEGMTMLRIPAGTFWMGDESGLSSLVEQPRHQVTIAEGFFMVDRPVTVRQFQQFVAHACSDRRCKAEAEIVKDWQLDASVSPDDDCPVQSVTWFHAVAFCNWLSRQQSGLTPCYKLTKHRGADWQCVLDPRASGYRLPSEAEWEYACRAKSERQYTFGDAEQLLGEYAWYDSNSSGRTWPAGRKLPNGWGLFDMHGNVWEWCEDVYHNSYEDAPRDGSARLDQATAGGGRVIRGGSWADHARYCRCACRYGWHPGIRNDYSGFRFVLAARFNEDVRAFS